MCIRDRIGHAVEVTYDYEHLLHGEAVSIGMVASTWMGVQAGLTDPELLNHQSALLRGLGLPIVIPLSLRERYDVTILEKRIKQMLGKDKKRTPKGLVWIVPERLGSGICTTHISSGVVGRCLRMLAVGIDWCTRGGL